MWCTARHGSKALLFKILINDFLKIHTNFNSEILSFADDNAILLSERAIDTYLYYEANRIINYIDVWFCKNKLKLNLFKSKYICFNPHNFNMAQFGEPKIKMVKG